MVTLLMFILLKKLIWNYTNHGASVVGLKGSLTVLRKKNKPDYSIDEADFTVFLILTLQ